MTTTRMKNRQNLKKTKKKKRLITGSLVSKRTKTKRMMNSNNRVCNRGVLQSFLLLPPFLLFLLSFDRNLVVVGAGWPASSLDKFRASSPYPLGFYHRPHRIRRSRCHRRCRHRLHLPQQLTSRRNNDDDDNDDA